MKEINISPRLLSAADFVRQDAILADIGTDHAYLPLFLLSEGRIKKAFCSDVNEGPLASARANAEAAGLLGKVEFTLADGADALCGRGITDYAICGMGGELISDIIGRAEDMRSPDVRLILQPMTRRGALAHFLYENGFEIIREEYSRDAGKYYVTLLVAYTGKLREIDELEAEFGRSGTPCKNLTAKIGYLKTKLASFEKRLAGVSRAKSVGIDYTVHVKYLKDLITEAERTES